ncbi:MAG: hypothetical protein ISS71_00380 [Phycisphaerae bacterium]|nr:hypothetical protein [Phycisphaerae bacterium]
MNTRTGAWLLSGLLGLSFFMTGCAAKRQLPPYPSDWPAAAQPGCDCSAISGTYADTGVEAQADGSLHRRIALASDGP